MFVRHSLARIVLVSLLGTSLGACATMSGHHTQPGQVSDSALTSNVGSALKSDPQIRSHDIDVKTLDGTVQLNGFVDSSATSRRAGELARGISGVRRVDNNLVVRASNVDATLGQNIDDTVVTTRVKSALIADPDTKARQIGVETAHGVVQLSGFVATDAERDRAGVVAKATSGVREVHNDLAVNAGR
jgi:hyperosmotically inducible protein